MATILIIDDSRTTRRHLAKLLGDDGHTIIEASDGVEGLERARRTPELGLILCDVNMPKLGGIGVLEAMHADPELSRIPIFMVTTEGQTRDIRRARDLGALGWILKPFRDEAVLHHARAVLGGQL